jgi:hypothetical protein
MIRLEGKKVHPSKTCAFQFDLLTVALLPRSPPTVVSKKNRTRKSKRKEEVAKKNEASSNYQEKANDKRRV